MACALLLLNFYDLYCAHLNGTFTNVLRDNMHESIAQYGTLKVTEFSTDTRTKDRFYGFHLMNLGSFAYRTGKYKKYT